MKWKRNADISDQLAENTAAMKRNTQAIEALVTQMAGFALSVGKELAGHDKRISRLESLNEAAPSVDGLD